MQETQEIGDVGLIPGSRRSSGEGNGNLIQYSCLGNSMDLCPAPLSLAGYSPWGHKEADATQHAGMHHKMEMTLSLYYKIFLRERDHIHITSITVYCYNCFSLLLLLLISYCAKFIN